MPLPKKQNNTGKKLFTAIDIRTPEELLALIEAKGQEIAAALAQLRTMERL